MNDLISKSALLQKIDEEREYLKARGLFGAEHILVHNFRELVENAPTVNHPNCDNCEDKAKQYSLGFQDGYLTGKERPQGEWIYTDKEDKKKGYGGYCSVCKCDMPIGINDWKQEYYESKFCPNCGAGMKKVMKNDK